MDYTLIRNDVQPYGVFGQMKSSDGATILATLEDCVNGAAVVPAGRYVCQRRLSPHFGYDVFEIMDVPGHDYIEIHIGNTIEDTHGCVLLGVARSGQMILQSRAAFNNFMNTLAGQDSFLLTITDAAPSLNLNG